MNLTNREKLIISSIVISRQNKYILTQSRKGIILEHFYKAFELNKEDLMKDLRKEQEQFLKVMCDLFDNKTLNIDCMYSNLDNREKYIFYHVSFLMQYLEKELYRTMVKAVAILFYPMPLNQYDILLDLIKDQINETFTYIEYVLQNKSFNT